MIEILRMTNIWYQEQGETQLQDFEFNMQQGEIVGLLPVNSHGVEALIRLLTKNLPLRLGYIYYREQLVNSLHYALDKPNRIAIIRSESQLVEGLSVAENIFVLRAGFKSQIIRPAMLRQQLQPFLDEMGVDISADIPVENLTIFQRFIAELVKALVVGAKLIILQDVSTFISENELEDLHRILRNQAAKGISFLYIGYHYEELRQICGRIAMFTYGKIIKVLTAESNFPLPKEFYSVRSQIQRRTGVSDKIVYSIQNFNIGGKSLSLSIFAGECLVIQDMQNRWIHDFFNRIPKADRDIAIIQALPAQTMIFPGMSYFDNVYMTIDRRLPGIWRRRKLANALKQEYLLRFGDFPFDKKVENLGKREKYDLVYRRILLQKPKIVFCIQPFKDADMALRMHILEHLYAFLCKNIAVVILTVNLSDTLALADRLVRFHKDSDVTIFPREEFERFAMDTAWVSQGE